MIPESASSFGKYVLIERLAAGKTGEVYLARVRGPLGFKKLCVIKRVPRTGDAATSGSFVDEGTTAAGLNHPHIVQVYDMGEHDRWMYLTTEYVEGKSLREVLSHAKRGLPLQQTVEIFVQLAAALGFAHEKGVVHRDVEPSNIVVAYSGEAKLIDFGSAASDGSDRTQTNAIGRRVPYMSPEQNASEEVDARTDVFSLGVCLYETLTGTNPFLRRNPVEASDAVRSFKPPRVSRIDPALKPFDGVISKAIAKRRNERFSSGLAMADALKAIWRQVGQGAPLSTSMQAWFPDEIHDEQYLARVALADADTNVGRRPTNVDKRASGDRNKVLGMAAGAFVVTVLATSLVTRAVVRSHDAVVDEKIIVAATSDAVQPKLGELVVKPAAQPVALPAAVENPPPAKSADPPLDTIAPTPQLTHHEPPRPKPVAAAKPDVVVAPPKPAPAARQVEPALRPAGPPPTAAAPTKALQVKPPATPAPPPAPAKASKAPRKDEKHDWTKDVAPSVIDDDDDE